MKRSPIFSTEKMANWGRENFERRREIIRDDNYCNKSSKKLYYIGMHQTGNNTEKNDEEIAGMVKDGEVDFFEILMDRYIEKIKRYARKFFSNTNEIDDIVQDVFIKAYENIQSFDQARKFSPWIYRIAHNQFVNHLKKKLSEKLLFLDFDTFFPHPEAKEKTEKMTDDFLTEKFLDKHLDILPAKYREPLVLYFYEEMDYQEISDILELPISTVGVRINRAKEKLKVLLDKEKIYG